MSSRYLPDPDLPEDLHPGVSASELHSLNPVGTGSARGNQQLLAFLTYSRHGHSCVFVPEGSQKRENNRPRGKGTQVPCKELDTAKGLLLIHFSGYIERWLN